MVSPWLFDPPLFHVKHRACVLSDRRSHAHRPLRARCRPYRTPVRTSEVRHLVWLAREKPSRPRLRSGVPCSCDPPAALPASPPHGVSRETSVPFRTRGEPVAVNEIDPRSRRAARQSGAERSRGRPGARQACEVRPDDPRPRDHRTSPGLICARRAGSPSGDDADAGCETLTGLPASTDRLRTTGGAPSQQDGAAGTRRSRRPVAARRNAHHVPPRSGPDRSRARHPRRHPSVRDRRAARSR